MVDRVPDRRVRPSLLETADRFDAVTVWAPNEAAEEGAAILGEKPWFMGDPCLHRAGCVSELAHDVATRRGKCEVELAAPGPLRGQDPQGGVFLVAEADRTALFVPLGRSPKGAITDS
jgi:hypothetical protein